MEKYKLAKKEKRKILLKKTKKRGAHVVCRPLRLESLCTYLIHVWGLLTAPAMRWWGRHGHCSLADAIKAFTDEVALNKRNGSHYNSPPAVVCAWTETLGDYGPGPTQSFFFSERAQPNLGCSGTKHTHTQLVESLSLIRLGIAFHGLDRHDHTRILVKDRQLITNLAKYLACYSRKVSEE